MKWLWETYKMGFPPRKEASCIPLLGYGYIAMTDKENYLRAVRFERPDFIPMVFAINDSCFHSYPQDALFELMERHPRLFPGFTAPKEKYVPTYALCARKDTPFRDDFGCVWHTSEDGITGTVTEHPLEDWADFEHYTAPDPDHCMGIGSIDWEKTKEELSRTSDRLRVGGLRHGHTFLQLCDIRGYQNAIFDMEDEEPRFRQLIQMIEDFNLAIVRHYLECGVDVMSYAEDLGMQTGPMLSPKQFRTYIKPVYERLMRPAREAGTVIHMHSDGDIRLLAGDLAENVDILNLQDLVNGIDWIADHFAGKLCIDLDVDRQNVTVFGTPAEVERMIHEEVTKIGSRQGGLMMIYGLYPGTPLSNVAALMDAMEQHMGYFD